MACEGVAQTERQTLQLIDRPSGWLSENLEQTAIHIIFFFKWSVQGWPLVQLASRNSKETALSLIFENLMRELWSLDEATLLWYLWGHLSVEDWGGRKWASLSSYSRYGGDIQVFHKTLFITASTYCITTELSEKWEMLFNFQLRWYPYHQYFPAPDSIIDWVSWSFSCQIIGFSGH